MKRRGKSQKAKPKKPGLNLRKRRILEIGLSVEAPKAKVADGLTVTPLMAKAAINHVVEKTERRGRNTPHAALPQAHVRKGEKVNLGAKKLKRNQILEERKNETYK